MASPHQVAFQVDGGGDILFWPSYWFNCLTGSVTMSVKNTRVLRVAIHDVLSAAVLQKRKGCVRQLASKWFSALV